TEAFASASADLLGGALADLRAVPRLTRAQLPVRGQLLAVPLEVGVHRRAAVGGGGRDVEGDLRALDLGREERDLELAEHRLGREVGDVALGVVDAVGRIAAGAHLTEELVASV